ncbi:MarR family winged helix-turn-helix transcriptional regulator [Pseudonocardia asaccharolytica]|uniref:MarR family transcriptional regulator n=1 Tax=Pseudonocardia asaccharolytica DSM 44247 = NBRC 16224 TaxID=1123024 RepID=A0A511CYW7_9PSEU|nr:MarR family transcriptional regulator [Pseudonocardia asaccharolytica]GEL16444.1 MarR family transcriptional regulator [Pseudonocardia asaccharolytica DSM 44247 = NBRC 16224]
MTVGREALTSEDLELADALARELAMLIRLVKRSARYPGAAGMDRAGFQVLVRLATEGPQRVVDVAEAVCADPSTVSRRVAALVKEGLIERQADPQDGRASLLAVTEQGLETLEHSRRYRAEVIAATIADWPREQRRQLVELLGRFTADFQRHDVPAAIAGRPGGGI